MARATAMSRRILMCENYEFGYSGEYIMNLSDTIFEFLDESCEGSTVSTTSRHRYDENEGEDEDQEKENTKNIEDDRVFWETQRQLLHDTLCRSSSLESRIRNATKEALKEAQVAGNYCVCQRPVADGCQNCLLTEISGCLRTAGFNSAICKSKWRSSTDIPSGEHTFLDVVESSPSKKSEVRVIIELNFRGEFKVARASEEYKQLTKKLPKVFVGKVEKLHNLIKILCSAAKKCMRENKMHMGPWRKHRYMQAKWLTAVRERATTAASPFWAVDRRTGQVRAARPRASMLTVDLLDNVPNLHMTAVEVV